MIKKEREEDVKKYTEQFAQAIRVNLFNFELKTGIKIERIDIRPDIDRKVRKLKICISADIFPEKSYWTYGLIIEP